MNTDFWTHTLSAENGAQAIYSKFYFELRRSDLADEIAAIRTEHGIILTTLEHECLRLNGRLPIANETENVFAQDPRSDIFQIDPFLVIDFLKDTENKLYSFYLDTLGSQSSLQILDTAASQLVLAKIESIKSRIEQIAKAVSVSPAGQATELRRVG